MHSGNQIEREACARQIVDFDTVIRFCIEAGQAIAFDQLLAEATGVVLEDSAPLIFSLLEGVVKHIPEEQPEKIEIRRIRGVANNAGLVEDHDSEWIGSILDEVGGANDGSWTLLPYLFATFMLSNIWNSTGFNVDTGGFNNNIHCLARCMSAVIAGSELVRLEREHQQKHSLSNGHASEALDKMQGRSSAEASIKSAMQLFVKFAAGIVLDSWNDPNRSHLVPKLILFDQLREISPYLPRSSFYLRHPSFYLHSILLEYSNATVHAAECVTSSLSCCAAHTCIALVRPRGDSTPQYSVDDSGYFKGSSWIGHDHLYDANSGSGSTRSTEGKHRSNSRSGPLDYSSSRKVKKFAEGSTSGSTGPSPLPQLFASRSGPLVYK